METLMGDDVTRVKEYFDVQAGQYNHYYGLRTTCGAQKVGRKTRLLIDFGNIKRGCSVLELGCGTGVYTEELAKTGADIFAVDLSRNMLDIAKHNVYAPNVSHVQCDATKLPFPDESIDSVVGTYVLQYINLDSCLPEFVRVLRGNGRVAFVEPNMANPVCFMAKKIGLVNTKLIQCHESTAFFSGQLKRILRRYGFVDIVVKPIEFVHPHTPLRLVLLSQKISRLLEKIPVIKEVAGSLFISATLARH
jgi:ubiquinone/menaquinone biosynthesis C-methylase UbiE